MQRRSDTFSHEKLVQGGIALFPIAGRAAGARVSIVAAIDTVAARMVPDMTFLSARETARRLNQKSLVEEYQEFIRDYADTGIASADVVSRIGQALQVRYLLYLTLGDSKTGTEVESDDDRIETYKHKRTYLLAQVWDATTGGLIWEAVSTAEASESDWFYLDSESREFFHSAAKALARRLFSPRS